ncbi:MAG: primosomal protein [Pseudonocardia sp.]|nr:primosomal protein [Pseudonocardia sp.]
MATDIVPIQLSLTAGDLITLWAPRWRDDGEDWEGFLGDEDAIHAFPDAPALAAYVRTVTDHDLADHPAWPLVRRLAVSELVPEEDHCYDLVGTPEIVADEPDTWTVGELAGIVTLVRSLADTCDLAAVHDVLNSAEGFALLERGSWSFTGRDGAKQWEQLAATIAERWDEVIDALDGMVEVPDVDQAALATARRELALENGEPAPAEADPAALTNGRPSHGGPDEDRPEPTDATASAPGYSPRSDAAAFWEEVGIDPILIGTDDGDLFTLRCYLDDAPVFLGSGGRIDVLPSASALAYHLAGAGADDHDLTQASTWPEVVGKANTGDLVVEVDPQNNYQLSGLGGDIANGPTAVDPGQLDLAVELLRDVGTWADDETAATALAPSQSLGWLISCILRPDPSRLTPSPPFDAESTRWNALVDGLTKRLRRP